MSEKRTIWGGMLTAFQRERKLAIELAHRAMKKRHPKAHDHEFRETKFINAQGETIYTVEMWQKIDEEHIKIKAEVTVETLNKAELKAATKEPTPPPLPEKPKPKKETSAEDLLS